MAAPALEVEHRLPTKTGSGIQQNKRKKKRGKRRIHKLTVAVDKQFGKKKNNNNPLYYKSCVRCRRLEQRREAPTEREAREVILRSMQWNSGAKR